MEAYSASFLLIGLRCGETRMALDAWSLVYAPGVSVFPARSGFTPGLVYFYVGGGTLLLLPCTVSHSM